jgi:glucan phosphoethanolaminetransferase (alkaline phosphatase superfamily)
VFILKNGRLALFVCTLTPMLAWPLSRQTLAHPWQALGWGLLCAMLAAATPARYLRAASCLQALILPLTLGWIGSIAVTGYAPSNAAFEAATSGVIHEVLAAAQLALRQSAFQLGAILIVSTLAWAIWANWRQSTTSRQFEWLFLICLLPLAGANMDALGYPSLAQVAGPEARFSVPWLFDMGLAKGLLKQTIDETVRGPGKGEHIRAASDADKTFTMHDGLAVFIVGESLRADALLQSGRGPWSQAMQERLAQGLGIRLRDACSGANSTFESVPRLLTAVDPGEVAAAASRPTILAKAKAAGAKTAYIINHGSWVVPESGHNLMQQTSTMENAAYDDTVIEAFGDFVARGGSGPKAALLHIYGQHFPYLQRYPAPAFPVIPQNLPSDTQEEQQYARAAEYGIKILLRAAHILDQQKEPAFLVFTSDHGENLVSDQTGKKYHALPISGKNDSTVPVLVLWNRAFAVSGKPQLLAPLVGTDGLIAHRDVALAWLALAGMSGPLRATGDPHTWGALHAGAPPASISCALLQP